MRKKQNRRPGKHRLTISLSVETRNYLESARKRAEAESMSAFLEDLVRDFKAREELAAIDAATTKYYDNLTDAEMEDEADWGRIGEASLAQFEE